MAISKRLRHEIMRRDNHTCRYCGASAPDVALTIDHVTPVTLGGSDGPSNLVTACKDCNAGKSSVPASAPLVEDVKQESIRWARAMEAAAEVADADRTRAVARHEEFIAAWDGWGSVPVSVPHNWRTSIDGFYKAGLTGPQIIDAVDRAMSGPADSDQVWRYFCGVCWSKVRELQEIAKQLLAVEEVDGL